MKTSKRHLLNQAAIPLAPTALKNIQMRPIVAEYDPRRGGVKQELSDLGKKYKCTQDEVPVEQEAGSTLPLMEIPGRDVEADPEYDPFANRKLENPTSNTHTLIHLLKGSLGSGILAMPAAFLNAGLAVGVVATLLIGIICTYCVHILVKISHDLCRRTQTPSLGYAETAEQAFLAGPPSAHRFSRLARAMVNIFLVIDLLGCCCVYVVFVAENLKQVVDANINHESFMNDLDVRIYMLLLLPLLIVVNMVKQLKHLSPFSAIANICVFVGMIITYYYIFQDLPSVSERENFAGWSKLPTFFGTAIFALEGIGVVMPLENNMKTPKDFIGCPGVLNTGMIVVVSLYTFTGFVGYWRYGTATAASITLNLPGDEFLGASVKVMIAIAIFLTYSLQFYVPMEIILKNIGHMFGSRKTLFENLIRHSLIIMTVGFAVAVPNLGPFISLVGAVCLSTLGLIFPAILETVTYWGRPDGFGRFNYVLWKNTFLVTVGVVGFVTGTYVSLIEIAGVTAD